MTLLVALFLALSTYAADPKPSIADSLGVPYETVTHDCGDILAGEDRYALQFRFKNLTADQFKKLKEAYGNQSEVVYKAGRVYLLSDFQAPKIQALIGQRFKSIEEPNVAWARAAFGENEDTTIRTETNCYGTLWELLRDVKDSIALFWADNFLVLEQLTAERFSTPIASAQRKPKDFVLFVDEREDGYQNLMHAALYIDGNVFFEKTDTGSEFVYRFVTFEDMQRKLARLAHHRLKALFFRPKVSTPAPAGVFTVGKVAEYSHIADLVPRRDRPTIIVGDNPGFGGRSSFGFYRLRNVGLTTGRDGSCSLKPTDPLTRRFTPAYRD